MRNLLIAFLILTTAQAEAFVGYWLRAPAGGAAAADCAATVTGGCTKTSISGGKIFVECTTNGAFTLAASCTANEALLIGGGGGATGGGDGGGGGGAGQVQDAVNLSMASGLWTVTIGSATAEAAVSTMGNGGGPSYLYAVSVGSITAVGGAPGGHYNNVASETGKNINGCVGGGAPGGVSDNAGGTSSGCPTFTGWTSGASAGGSNVGNANFIGGIGGDASGPPGHSLGTDNCPLGSGYTSSVSGSSVVYAKGGAPNNSANCAAPTTNGGGASAQNASSSGSVKGYFAFQYTGT